MPKTGRTLNRSVIGIVLNRLTVGFVFAFVYQIMTGIATSILQLPLTGTIQDLIWGLGRADLYTSALAVAWWIISTIAFTVIAMHLVKYRRYISPYKGESGISKPLEITIFNILILGAVMSFLFFLVDLTVGVVESGNTVADVQTIYQLAISGDLRPLGISMMFSIVAGFVVVWVIGRAAKIKELTRGMGAIDMEHFKKIVHGDSVSRTSATVGLEPGTLVHVGEKKVSRAWFWIVRYDADTFYEVKKTYDIEECLKSVKGGTNWLNMTGVHDAGSVEKFGNRFRLHHLLQSDIMNTELRPAFTVDKEKIFLILKMPYYDGEGNLVVEHISIVLDRHYVLSFQESEGHVFANIQKHLREGRGDYRKKGSDYLLYALIDAIVDNFFVVMETIGNQTEELEHKLMDNPGPEVLYTIYGLKRQMVLLRKAIWPIREVINGLTRSDSPLIKEDTKDYLRDVYNHTVQTMDTIESIRDMVGGMLDTYLSSVSNKMNEVMKTLTIIASIFIPITFVAGIYGTNFAYVPELEWEGSYFVMLGMMGVIVAIMAVWFRRKGWL